MGETNNREQQISNSKVILYALIVATAMYGVILVILDLLLPVSEETSSVGAEIEILPLVFMVVSGLVILIVFKFLNPRIMAKEDFSSAFPLMLLTSVLLEVVGLLGFMLGLLDIFVIDQEISWNLVSGFIGVSIVLQFYVVNKKFQPKLDKLRDDVTFTQDDIATG